MKTIVLRLDVDRMRDKQRISSGSNTPPPSALTVETHDLTPAERADLARDRSVLGYAPPVPLKLIKPLDVDVDAALLKVPPAVSWGIQAVNAAKPGFSGEGVTVAVLDTGINIKENQHPAFKGVELEREDFTGEGADDKNGHGTHCAGTIFGRDCDGTRIGVARGISRGLIGKVIGDKDSSTEALYRAILWAAYRRAHVISLSLGIDFTRYRESLAAEHPPEVATSIALVGFRETLRLFDRLSTTLCTPSELTPGAVVVVASGNESRRDLNLEHVVAHNPPATAQHFISVGALEKASSSSSGYRVAPFSNTGVRLVAPGVDIWSANHKGGLRSLDGTSMAVPHVAGVAALWVEKLLKAGVPFQAAQIVKRLEESALPLSEIGRDNVGLGLVQAP